MHGLNHTGSKRSNGVSNECPFTEMVHRYLAKQTSEAENEQVHAHLTDCPQCYALMVANMSLEHIEEPTEADIESLSRKWTKSPEQLAAQMIAHAKVTDEASPAVVESNSDGPTPAPQRWGPGRIFTWSAGPLLAALLLIGFSIGGGPLLTWMEGDKFPDNLEYYVRASVVPYPFDGSSFRNMNESDSTAWRSFTEFYKKGILHYMEKDFSTAIAHFSPLESSIGELMRTTTSPIKRQRLRDYHFYFGVTHLAISKTEGMDQLKREEHLARAVELLTKARNLESQQPGMSGAGAGGQTNLGNPVRDRETYFLALAYWFSEDTSKAQELIRQIPEISRFFRDSQILQEEWSRD